MLKGFQRILCFNSLTKKQKSWYRKMRYHQKKHLEWFLPYAFTEHGVLMLASVLKSERAMQMSIRIIEVFIKMREILLAHKDILLQLEKIETKLTGHDEDIQLIFKYLKQLLNPPQKPRQKIGFKRSNEEQIYAVGQSVPLGRPKQHVRIRTIGSSDSFSLYFSQRAFIQSYDEPTFILPGPEAPFLVASELALRSFRFFYLVLYKGFRYRQKVVRDNLVNSFPGKSIKEIIKIEQKFYSHFCDLIVESIRLFSISEKELGQRCKLLNPEILDQFYDRGKV